MKLLRFIHNNKKLYGIAQHENVRVIHGDIFGEYTATDTILKIEDIKILPPCDPTKIVCVRLNYYEHQLEMNEFADKFPILFIKPNTAVIAHNENIINPKGVDRVDFEAELAVVIKKRAKNIKKGTAKDYILGYTCFNDVTAREIQKQDGQWTRAKSFDTFAPVGPYITTEVEPDNLDIQLLVNGQVRQHSNTNKLIWNVDFLVEQISNIMTLLPGDIIATGTPSGCGKMEDGDKVEVIIEKLGTLTNHLIGGEERLK